MKNIIIMGLDELKLANDMYENILRFIGAHCARIKFRQFRFSLHRIQPADSRPTAGWRPAVANIQNANGESERRISDKKNNMY